MKSPWLVCAYFFSIVLLITSSHGARRARKGPLTEALSLGQTTNTSRDDCVWRVESDSCAKTSVKFVLHTVDATSEVCNESDGEECTERRKIEPIDIHSPAFLHSSGYDPAYETIVLIHGYGGYSDTLPAGVLKDAYLRNGSYNVIVVDWTELSRLPCYIAAVHNMKAVAKCVAELFTFLRNSGVEVSKTICVGHSLGAHICGITANYLNFRMQKIIGVDPAKPFVPNNAKGKLDVNDAVMVQVLHTSSNYGDSKKTGHIDIYFNGGRTQPFCSNAPDQELCSHTRSVCYLAESIFSTSIRYATKCRRRNIEIENNSRGIFNRLSNPHNVPIGQATPIGTFGTYCVSNKEPPFCSRNGTAPSHPLCCKTTNIEPSPILCCQDENTPSS